MNDSGKGIATNSQDAIPFFVFSFEEATRAMQLLLNRFMPLISGETGPTPHRGEGTGPHQADTAGRTAVMYRIRLTEKTGRVEKR